MMMLLDYVSVLILAVERFPLPSGKSVYSGIIATKANRLATHNYIRYLLNQLGKKLVDEVYVDFRDEENVLRSEEIRFFDSQNNLHSLILREVVEDGYELWVIKHD